MDIIGLIGLFWGERRFGSMTTSGSHEEMDGSRPDPFPLVCCGSVVEIGLILWDLEDCRGTLDFLEV